MTLVQLLRVQTRHARRALTQPASGHSPEFDVGSGVWRVVSVILPQIIGVVQQAAIAITGSRVHAGAGKPGGGVG